MNTLFAKGLVAAALAAGPLGCVVGVEDTTAGVPPPGTLTVAYTIVGQTDPGYCSYYSVSDAELVVYSPAGSVIDDLVMPCDAFQVSTDLYPGTYNADVTLLDSLNRPRSITKPLYDIRVVADTEVVIDVDFPPNSFL
jgi:hypothetical protein